MTAQETPQLESGTYEIIRQRLDDAAGDLRQRLEALNASRKAVFGAIETKLIGSSRITTENNCTPRDMIVIGDHFLFGYNVQMGLKSNTSLQDVFAVYQYRQDGFHPIGLDLLNNERFLNDFQALYKYYKKTVFSKFAVQGPHLHMKFRVGKSVNDFKTFKWVLDGDRLTYVDNRSDHEFSYPDQHEFEWIRCRRDWHRQGTHPHISIEDRVFVETVGGDLTIKVEDNTESGQGIYEEPVDNADQTLDDADIYYAALGHLILLKIRPYDESAYRYLVFNEKLGEVTRIDAIEDACILLPEDMGIIFPSGFYLVTGEHKQFDIALKDMTFFRRIPAANGEDILYVFLNRLTGNHILLHYNLIEQRVETPILCHGYTIFPDGKMVYFQGENEPQKHHALQIWQTPFGIDEPLSESKHTSPLFNIGNKPIVRCMAECKALLKLLSREDSYANLYVDIVKKSGDLLDSYFWIRDEISHAPGVALATIRETAENAIEAFEKVSQMRKATAQAVAQVSQAAEDLQAKVRHAKLDHIQEFVTYLAAIRRIRGELIATKDLRYVDLATIEALEEAMTACGQSLSTKCVAFLLRDDALDSYRQQAKVIQSEITALKKGTDAKRLEEKTKTLGEELEMLIDIVSNLKIDDPTETTRIIEQISGIFADLNQLRAGIKNRQKELAASEGVAEFNAQLKLLDQATVNYLGLCDDTAKTETYLTKLMVTLEELEGRFSEFEDFLEQLAEKREEVYNAFENRRLQLVEARNKRTSALASAGARLLKGISSRARKFTDIQDIHGYFAGDLMVTKIRDMVEELVALEDVVKADDLQTQLKTIKEEAIRQLKDRQDLFAEGENTIQFGKHRFLVNALNLAPTIIPRGDAYFYHLTGTNFFAEVEDESFTTLLDVASMTCASENDDVYRAEYLAFLMLQEMATQGSQAIKARLTQTPEDFAKSVQTFMGPRYDEAYTKGIHDVDAAKIFKTLLEMRQSLGLLTHAPSTRAMAELYWEGFCSPGQKQRIQTTVASLSALCQAFPETTSTVEYEKELEALIMRFVETTQLFSTNAVGDAAQYLFQRLLQGDHQPKSHEAAQMYRGFVHQLEHRKANQSFRTTQESLQKEPSLAFQVLRTWVRSYQQANHPKLANYVDEVAVLAFRQAPLPHLSDEFQSQVDLKELRGDHARVNGGQYHLDYHHFMERLKPFHRDIAPRFREFQALKHQLLEQFAQDLRLEEFKPRVLSSFVRNQLIDDVYLPLIGNNLAKQIGAAGDNKRTDRMGLLLLVSPPGYGKTTLMEYVANRLGLIFMKINGPALGHDVTSLDPASAPHASAREELKKLNLALEMGDNIMLYLDDIQHCHPEFLQKFISLCDAQRKIEGVYGGRTRTYDLRGKKVCVVMAGNPYTESGDKFQIPDMLANRADTYNLGDMVNANPRAFQLSYIENSLTANPILNRLAAGSQKDIRTMVTIAETGEREDLDFEGSHTPEAVGEYVEVLQKMLRVRDVVLKVNQQYIQSAAQEEAYRSEPPFKLQGSYRNMNKMAAQILPIMNEEELEKAILSHYENEAQTLTTGAEANLLKFKHMFALQSDDEAARWQDILGTFAKRQSLFGFESGDKMGQILLQLSQFQDGLKTIAQTLESGFKSSDQPPLSQALEVTAQTHLSQPSLDALASILKPPAGQGHQEQSTEALPLSFGGESVADLSKANHLYKVLRHQFTIMHHWLKPMYDMDLKQNKEMDQLHAAVKASLGTHAQIIEYLEMLLGKKPKASPKKATAKKRTPKKDAPPPKRRSTKSTAS